MCYIYVAKVLLKFRLAVVPNALQTYVKQCILEVFYAFASIVSE
jgi:hypothetical protein